MWKFILLLVSIFFILCFKFCSRFINFLFILIIFLMFFSRFLIGFDWILMSSFEMRFKISLFYWMIFSLIILKVFYSIAGFAENNMK